MALTIANNVTSLNAQNNLSRSASGLASSVERLSSGLKVNRGADGPAALVISEKQRAQIAGLKQAIDNSNKAVALVQTAEGALSEINDLLVKVRSLAIDSANIGVNDTDALAANQAEITNALETVGRIANNTQFGTKKLLDGSAGVNGSATSTDVVFLKASHETIQGNYSLVVSNSAQRAVVTAGTAQTAALDADEQLNINGVFINLMAGDTQQDIVDRINAETRSTGAIADIAAGSLRIYSTQFGSDATISVVSDTAAAVDSSGIGMAAALTDTGRDIEITINGGTAITGKGNTLTSTLGATKGISLQFKVSATDPTESVTGAQGTLSISNDALVFQIGPNQNQTAKIAINKMDALSLGLGVANNQFSNLSEIDVRSTTGAQDAIGIIDKAINDVTSLRGALGAFQQHTLNSTANNLRTTLENTTNAESVIRDTDFASEIANFTKYQVLVQAGTSILGSANQIPQNILALLR